MDKTRLSGLIPAVTAIAAIVAGAALAAACGRKAAEPAAAAYPVRIETVDGLRTVHNPDYPRDGLSTPALIEELSIGESEGGDGYLFNRPQWLRVDAEGRIYVLDWGDVCIEIFDASGRHLRTIGRRGQGPGEFDTPVYFDLTPDGNIALMDGRNNRVAVLDPEGGYRGGFRVEGFHSGMACDSAGRIFIQNQTAGAEVETVTADFQAIPFTTTVWRLEPDGQAREKIGDFGGEVRGLRRTPDGGAISLSPPFSNLWTVDPADRLVIGFNAAIDFTVYGPDLRPQLRFLRDFTPAKNPRYSGEAWQNEYYPALERFFILADDEGSFWLERAIPPTRMPAEKPGEEADWVASPNHVYDVFDSEGIYCREMTFPFRIQAVRGGKLYAMVRDDEGYVSVKRYRIAP